MHSTEYYKKYKHLRRVAINIWQASRAKRRYNNPQRGLRLIGVTGTDGKTTTSTMIASILRQSGRSVGLISTVGAKINDQEIDTGLHVSTPGPAQIYELLAKMKAEGVQDVVIETTSHGLDQRRLFGLSFILGVITNISAEHLDYHGNMEDYARAKALLLDQSGLAILNADDPIVIKMNTKKLPQITFGINNHADVSAKNINADGKGSSFEITYKNQKADSKAYIPLPGDFNVSNAIAAASAALALQLPTTSIIDGLAHVTISGRWQVIQHKPFAVIVDFAHTPQAFEAVLPTAKSLVQTKGRLIHVFGSAAQRDEQKRSQMGQLSARYADITVLTMEDPRFESLDRIQEMIASGLKAEHKIEQQDYWRIDDRNQAIEWAIHKAKPGDVVIITGKGHEQSLSIKGKEYPWSDVLAVNKALKSRGST